MKYSIFIENLDIFDIDFEKNIYETREGKEIRLFQIYGEHLKIKNSAGKWIIIKNDINRESTVDLYFLRKIQKLYKEYLFDKAIKEMLK